MTTQQGTAPQTTLDLYTVDMQLRSDVVYFTDKRVLRADIPFTVVSRAIDLGLVHCPSCEGVLDGTTDDNGLLRCARCGFMLEG